MFFVCGLLRLVFGGSINVVLTCKKSKLVPSLNTFMGRHTLHVFFFLPTFEGHVRTLVTIFNIYLR